MLKRPGNHDKFSNMRGYFNNALEGILFERKSYIQNYILSIEVDQEEFVYAGYLSNTG